MSKYGVVSGPYFPAFGLNTEKYEVSFVTFRAVTNLRTRIFVVDLWYQQYCNDIMKITGIKCGLLSKGLFERTQHYSGFTKPLGNDKFL